MRGSARAVQCAFLLLAVAIAAPGCNIRKMALRETGKVMAAGSVALNREPDYEFARISMPASLKTVEVMLESLPDDPNMLMLLAQGYGAYAFLFLEDEVDLADEAGDTARVNGMKERAAGLYLRAQDFAARMFADPTLRKTLETADINAVKDRLAKLKKDDAPAVFWYAYAWIGRINLDQSNPERIGEVARVEAIIVRLADLYPDYYGGLPLLTAGGLFAARPPMFGGDLKRGREYIEKGIAVTQGRFLVGSFLLGRFYAIQAQDRALFCTKMAEIVAADATKMPEQVLMNNVAKRWAARWLGRADGLFTEGGCAVTAPAGGSTDNQEDDDELQ